MILIVSILTLIRQWTIETSSIVRKFEMIQDILEVSIELVTIEHIKFVSFANISNFVKKNTRKHNKSLQIKLNLNICPWNSSGLHFNINML